MKARVKRTVVALAAAAIAAACADSTGTGGTPLSAAQTLALTTAITGNGLLTGAGTAASYAPLAITLLGSAGPLSARVASREVAMAISASVRGTRAATYADAFGVQVIYTSTAGSGTWTGVLGWEGLNVAASTVDEFVAAGAATATVTPVAAGSTNPIAGPSGSAGGWASYWTNATSSRYDGTSGVFLLTSTNFSGAGTDCSTLSSTSQCSYVAGTIAGSFTFDATRVAGTGAPTYSQTTVNFNGLPALRVTVTR